MLGETCITVESNYRFSNINIFKRSPPFILETFIGFETIVLLKIIENIL